MDSSQSRQTSSMGRPPLQMYNFMPMSTSTSLGNQQIGEARNSMMQGFWNARLKEICEDEAPSDIREKHPLPIARIKKVMKSDEQVKMISADTPVVFAKACELFIMELTLRAWMHTEANKRRTLQRNDVATAIRDEDLLFFLEDLVPMEIYQEAELSLGNQHGGHVPLSIRGTPTMPLNNPTNVQSMINQSEAAPRGRPTAATDHRLAFLMNLQYNADPFSFTRNQEMQQNLRSPPPSEPATGDNAYHYFRNFLQ